jgi:hypothetical protein
MTTAQIANSGPTKLCSVLRNQVSQPNSSPPMIGRSRNLPNEITAPETASMVKVIAVLQWTRRSKGVKRSISRPVGFSWPAPIGPFHQ